MELENTELSDLATLKAETKFKAHLMYSGAPDEAIRARCESGINRLIDTLMHGLPKQPNAAFVLSTFQSHLDSFVNEDTEEKERACGYCEQIMDILGMESLEGVLNNWLYGLDPNEEP